MLLDKIANANDFQDSKLNVLIAELETLDDKSLRTYRTQFKSWWLELADECAGKTDKQVEIAVFCLSQLYLSASFKLIKATNQGQLVKHDLTESVENNILSIAERIAHKSGNEFVLRTFVITDCLLTALKNIWMTKGNSSYENVCLDFEILLNDVFRGLTGFDMNFRDQEVPLSKQITIMFLRKRGEDFLREIYEAAQKRSAQRAVKAQRSTARITLLANRDQDLIVKHGARSVDKLFEHEIALLFQSFGAKVVTTKIAHKTADILCIADAVSTPFTFIVEAKSSKNRYSLPSKDYRALLDYINDAKSSLTLLPPLKALIIVGSEPSKTLQSKLEAVQNESGVTTRFLHAHHLAGLRQSIPGAINFSIFLKELRVGAPVLDENFVRALAEYDRKQLDAIETLVRSSLSYAETFN